MRLYTVQEDDIVEKVFNGHVHVQPWERSAAFTGTPNDPDGVLHRRAYEYAAREFEPRTGSRMDGAPVFAGLNMAQVVSTFQQGRPSRLLTLDVPESQILLQDYELWQWTILWGWCRMHLDHCPGPECAEATWADGFEMTEAVTIRQAILACIEPSWVMPWSDRSALAAGLGRKGIATAIDCFGIKFPVENEGTL